MRECSHESRIDSNWTKAYVLPTMMAINRSILTDALRSTALCFSLSWVLAGLPERIGANSLTVVEAIPYQQNDNGYGSVEGVVMTRTGLPVEGATVYALQDGRTPFSATDKAGKFTLRHVAVGQHWIFAYKESDGFPNLLWSFYSEAYGTKGFPIVNVRENKTLSDVIIHFGERACNLSINVIDAETMQPVKDAQIALNHKDKPKTLFKPGSTTSDGRLEVLVPAAVPISLNVTATGYRVWHYAGSTRFSGAILLKPGSKRNLTVELQRSN